MNYILSLENQTLPILILNDNSLVRLLKIPSLTKMIRFLQLKDSMKICV